MGTIADKLNRLVQTKTEIRSLLVENGQTVPEDLPFSQYLNKIDNAIQSSGSNAPSNDITLGMIPEGNVICLNEDDVPTPFYIAKHDYEPDLNGLGRTLLVRVNGYALSKWNSAGTNIYANSTIDTYLNTTYKSVFDEDTLQKIGTTKFYYTPMGGNTTLSVLERSIFVLSIVELTTDKPQNANDEGSLLPIYDQLLKTITFNGAACDQWSRTPRVRNTNEVYYISSSGARVGVTVNGTAGLRPCFTFPSDYVVYKGSSGTGGGK